MSMDDETDSRYTTGDIAKLTGVSVRTVQYYDAKGLLIPNEISDGGRRLYGTAEVERMRVILFLKGLGFKLEQIRPILSEERPERVLVDLLDQQTASLQSGIAEQKQRLDDCLQLRKALTVSASDFVSPTLTDMATVMNTTTTHSLRTAYQCQRLMAATLEVTQYHHTAKVSDVQGVCRRVETDICSHLFLCQQFFRTRHHIVEHATPF